MKNYIKTMKKYFHLSNLKSTKPTKGQRRSTQAFSHPKTVNYPQVNLNTTVLYRDKEKEKKRKRR